MLKELASGDFDSGNEFMAEPAAQNGNSSTTALAKLLNQLNLPTLALILLTGGGNWFATEKTSSVQREETQKAISQIHDLHDAFATFEARQKEALESLNQIQRNQTLLLQNQSDLLKKLHQLSSPQPQ